MTNKLIIIPFDYNNVENPKSYMETLEAIEKQEGIIYTNCLDFFSFYYLEKGYDVKVVKQNGDFILLSELLTDTENLYTRKEIRKAHDARRMLIANTFQFQQQKNR